MPALGLLSSFNVIVQAVQHFYNGFKALDDWWLFEQSYCEFINDIQFENLRLERNLDSLLGALVLRDDIRDELLHNLNTSLWDDATLIQQIERHLGGNHELYMATLSNMRSALSELMELLPIKDGKVCYVNEGAWEHECRRIQYTFRKREGKILDRIRSHNNKLGVILNPSRLNTGHSSMSSYSGKSSSKMTNKLARRRTHAKMLITALDKSLQCNCPESHSCGIIMRAAKENDAEDGHIQIIFLQLQPIIYKVEARVRRNRYQGQGPLTTISRLKELAAETRIQVQQRMIERKRDTVKSFFRAILRKDNGLSEQPAKAQHKETQTPPTKQKIRVTGVRFADEEEKANDEQTYPSISDLCSLIRKPPTEECWGSIPVDGKGTVTLFSRPTDSRVLASKLQAPSLAQVIADGLKKPDRLRMAKNITFAMLELQGASSSVPGAWSKADIVISEALGGGIYIQRFPSARTTQPEKVVNSLLSLGILLLELAFGQTLESQSCREIYMSNGTPHDLTDFCTALKWCDQVYYEFGTHLAGAIKWCITNGINRSLDFESQRLITEVVENVIMPLDDFLRQWEK